MEFGFDYIILLLASGFVFGIGFYSVKLIGDEIFYRKIKTLSDISKNIDNIRDSLEILTKQYQDYVSEEKKNKIEDLKTRG